MCLDPLTMIAIASTGLQVMGQIQAGNAAQQAAEYNARILRLQGKQEMDAANLQAGDIRTQGTKHLGEIKAIQGASGVDPNSGSALEVGAADQQAYEEDALRALYGGQIKRWGLRTQADMAIYEGKVAKQQSYVRAAGTLLSSAAQANFGAASPASSLRPVSGSTGFNVGGIR